MANRKGAGPHMQADMQGQNGNIRGFTDIYWALFEIEVRCIWIGTEIGIARLVWTRRGDRRQGIPESALN